MNADNYLSENLSGPTDSPTDRAGESVGGSLKGNPLQIRPAAIRAQQIGRQILLREKPDVAP